MFLVQNILVGKALISSPFAVYGGILADSDEVRFALRDAARELGRYLGVQYVELRNAWEEQLSGLPQIRRYVTFTAEIGSGQDAILAAIPRKQRAEVRYGIKANLTSRVATDSSNFERLYSESLRRLGTPCFPSRHFAELRRNFGEQAGIREVMLGDKIIAAVFTFYFRDQVLPYYGASDTAHNDVSPANFMYFDLMRWGSQNGYRTFDFGRSRIDTGSYHFKARWGMQMRELPYEMILVRRKELPNFSPGNPKFQAAIRLWQRMPLPVTRAVGPWFIKWVP